MVNHVTIVKSLDKSPAATILVFESVSSCILSIFLRSHGANQISQLISG